MDSFHGIWRYANIVLFKTYANLKTEISKTYIGCIWWVLEPMINTAVFYSVFTFLANGRFQKNIIFIYIGTAIYGWFSGAINAGAISVISNPGLLQQVYLPKILFPFITISNLSWKFLFSFIVLLPLLWFNQLGMSTPYFALPFLLLLQYFMVIGISLPFAILMPYFPDGKTVLSAFLNVFMWLSGVFYAIDSVPGKWRPWFYANPIAGLIEAHRAVLMDRHWPIWNHLVPGIFTALVFWTVGFMLFKRLDRKITKIAM